MGNLPDTGGVARAGLATCVAVFLGGGAQLLAELQEYRTRSVFGATSFTVFGLFWITIGVTGWLTGMHLLPHRPRHPRLLPRLLDGVRLHPLRRHPRPEPCARDHSGPVRRRPAGQDHRRLRQLAVFTRVGAWLLIACATAAAYTRQHSSGTPPISATCCLSVTSLDHPPQSRPPPLPHAGPPAEATRQQPAGGSLQSPTPAQAAKYPSP